MLVRPARRFLAAARLRLRGAERLRAGFLAVVLRAVVLRAVVLRDADLRAVDLRALVVRFVVLRAVDLRAVLLRAVVLRDALLRAVVRFAVLVLREAVFFTRRAVRRFVEPVALCFVVLLFDFVRLVAMLILLHLASASVAHATAIHEGALAPGVRCQ